MVDPLKTLLIGNNLDIHFFSPPQFANRNVFFPFCFRLLFPFEINKPIRLLFRGEFLYCYY